MTDLSVSTAISTTTTQSSSSSSSSTLSSLTEDFDDFLNLLVVQLQNQSPLDPMDTTELTNQIVNFTGVEQQVNTNTKLDTIATLLSGNSVGTAIDYLNQMVEFAGETTVVQNGVAQWSYALADTADAVTLTVTDADGTVVWSGDGSGTSGNHDLVLDSDDLGGFADGEAVTLTVSAVSADGSTISSDIYGVARVTGVDTTGDRPVLTFGTGLSVATDDVTGLTV